MALEIISNDEVQFEIIETKVVFTDTDSAATEFVERQHSLKLSDSLVLSVYDDHEGIVLETIDSTGVIQETVAAIGGGGLFKKEWLDLNLIQHMSAAELLLLIAKANGHHREN
ncbi:hypothetical protein [Metabacillus sp. Hm71]|uniref:hypothetical protein n=1 Tax=Metabacillus sp. Hm71 TaxID=3450743 RepID=UPI003F443298